MNDSVHASKLYGTPAKAPAEPPSTHPDADLAESLYEPDPYQSFPPVLRQTFTSHGEDQAVVLGRTPTERLKFDRSFAEVAKRSRLDDYVTARIYEATVAADIAELRGVGEEMSQMQQDAEDTRAEVFGTYGPEDGAKWLGVAREFIRQHPRLASMLDRRGIGNRKDIVIPILEHARRLHLSRMKV